MKLHRIFIFAIAALVCGGMAAKEPSGYYDACKGKGGEDLLNALFQKIGSPNTKSYAALWTMYKTSDLRPDGYIWDMYSTVKFTYKEDQCGNYSGVGSCYNREHSFPKSWFNDASPMVSDGFHIYPTDGKVNGMRGNHPFGECNGESWSDPKALGKLGSCTYPGYSGTVFEPDDQYKGDFARSYFYMAAAYYDRNSSWSSPMLAGNNYPFFKDWALNMLLEWHRKDPVSDKETNRNDAVQHHQGNRNPFIDHPELVEYIWGNKKTQTWNGSDTPETGAIILPVDGSTVDMGTAGIGVPVSTVITVKGKDLTSAVSVSATNALALSATTISASQANAGYELKLTWTLKQAGSYTSVLTLASGPAKSTVTVKARVEDGLPATAATEITESSFRANWVYVGDDTDGKYTLDVKQGAESIDGYPRDVDAAAGRYTVDGLTESTAYSYTLKSKTMTSNTVGVTTLAPVPFVQFLYDGELSFACEPGAISAAEELLVDMDNVSQNVAVSVDAPFQISTDKTSWSTQLSLLPDEDRMYIRFAPERAGTFTTEITATVGEYTMESGVITGICTDPAAEFIETFEANFAKTYTDGEYEGSACRWMFNNVGVVSAESAGDRVYAGEKSCRFGKDRDSSIEMIEDKQGGAGTVSFYACRWVNNQGTADEEAKMNVDYSTDGGATWKTAGEVSISASNYTRYSVAVNVAGNVRLRLQQTAGKRLHLDDVSVPNYMSGIHDAAADPYYGWDAFAPEAGTLRVETDRAVECSVHGADGITYAGSVSIAAGATDFALPAGLYIVVVDGQSRRVLVK